MKKIKKIVVAILLTMAVGMGFKPAAAEQNMGVFIEIEQMKRQILLLQIELVKTQIAVLQKQLAQITGSAEGAFIDVISPAGGERIAKGSAYRVNWESKGVNKVAIELKTSEVGIIIANGVAASSGQYDWRVNDVAGNDFKIRIFDPDHPEVSGTSSGKFSIVDRVSQDCDDGTRNGRCSASKPLYCDNGRLVSRCGVCGCAGSDQCLSGGACQKVSACSDGTLTGSCSASKPRFCSGVELKDMCGVCGCPAGSVCGRYGICYTAGSCGDGTLAGRCSANKPKLCVDDGVGLIDACNSCGCLPGKTCNTATGICESPAGANQFVVNDQCRLIHEGSRDHSKAINVVIIGADALYSSTAVKYSQNFSRFSADVELAMNKFLSIDPFSRHKNIFNFYRAGNMAYCAESPIHVAGKDYYPKPKESCQGWQEAINACGIGANPLMVIVVVGTNTGGASNSGSFIVAEADGLTWTHEIAHSFGLADESYFGQSGPNIFKTQGRCVLPLCSMRPATANWFSGNEYVSAPGGTCCYPLENINITPTKYSDYYATNEGSIMQTSSSPGRAEKFSLAAQNYLEKVLAKIAATGSVQFSITAGASPEIAGITRSVAGGSVNYTLTTGAPANCRYSVDRRVGYAAMPGRMLTNNIGTTHTANIGAPGAGTHTVYFQCTDAASDSGLGIHRTDAFNF